jgi:hypothetical protein
LWEDYLNFCLAFLGTICFLGDIFSQNEEQGNIQQITQLNTTDNNTGLTESFSKRAAIMHTEFEMLCF